MTDEFRSPASHPEERWEHTLQRLVAVPSSDLPAQLDTGIGVVADIPGSGSPSTVGDVFTSVAGTSPQVWTENWVVSTDAVFTSATRTTRVSYADPQPSPPQSKPSGYTEAALVFSYQDGTNCPAWPNPGGTVLVFDVYNGAVGSMSLQGRLFRKNSGSSSQEWWLLYPGYVKPTGTTVMELRPNNGTPSNLWSDARQSCQQSGGLYVNVSYTRSQIP